MHSKSGAGREREPGSGKGAPGVKKHSNRVPPGASSSSATQNQNIDHANGVSGLS